MIATRFNPLGINASPTAKSYIQDGLIHMWDGIENVGYGIHDESATSWVDLVSGLVATSHNRANPPEWGELGLKGRTGYRQQMRAPISSLPAGTVEVVMSLTNEKEQWPASNRVDNQGGTFWQVYKYSSQSFCSATKGGITHTDYRETIPNYVAISADANGVNVYVDGVLHSSKEGDFASVIFNGEQIALGGPILWADSYVLKTGSFLHAVRMYDKALTADEIAFKYAIDKERFGI